MNQPSNHLSTRREFIKATGNFAAASALAGIAIPHVHAEGSSLIQLALIGCGGRGTGAADNALAAKRGPTKLVAMADVFENKLRDSYEALKRKCGDRAEVPEDRKFIGFDAYKKAMDCLKPGDIAIFTTPLAFRWVHFTYAIEKRLNVFMEKPLTADGPTSRRMLELAEEATAKNLKVGVGLMSRHSRALQELSQHIQDGEIGDVILLRGYRMHGPVGSAFSTKWPGNPSELLWQIQKFHSFLWASGGCFSDFYIFRFVFGGIHLRRRRQNDDGWALHQRLQRHLFQLRAWQQRHGHRFQVQRLRISLQHFQGPESAALQPDLDL